MWGGVAIIDWCQEHAGKQADWPHDYQAEPEEQALLQVALGL